MRIRSYCVEKRDAQKKINEHITATSDKFSISQIGAKLIILH